MCLGQRIATPRLLDRIHLIAYGSPARSGQAAAMPARCADRRAASVVLIPHRSPPPSPGSKYGATTRRGKPPSVPPQDRPVPEPRHPGSELGHHGSRHRSLSEGPLSRDHNLRPPQPLGLIGPVDAQPRPRPSPSTTSTSATLGPSSSPTVISTAQRSPASMGIPGWGWIAFASTFEERADRRCLGPVPFRSTTTVGADKGHDPRHPARAHPEVPKRLHSTTHSISFVHGTVSRLRLAGPVPGERWQRGLGLAGRRLVTATAT